MERAMEEAQTGVIDRLARTTIAEAREPVA